MTALTLRSIENPTEHLTRHICAICFEPVMWVVVRKRLRLVNLLEWEPRAACERCQQTRRRMHLMYEERHPGEPVPPMRVHCSRCGNTGYVGSDRPQGRMVAIDVGWSDEEQPNQPHVRIIGPSTDRRRGEALYPIHVCQTAVLERRQAA